MIHYPWFGVPTFEKYQFISVIGCVQSFVHIEHIHQSCTCVPSCTSDLCPFKVWWNQKTKIKGAIQFPGSLKSLEFGSRFYQSTSSLKTELTKPVEVKKCVAVSCGARGSSQHFHPFQFETTKELYDRVWCLASFQSLSMVPKMRGRRPCQTTGLRVRQHKRASQTTRVRQHRRASQTTETRESDNRHARVRQQKRANMTTKDNE